MSACLSDWGLLETWVGKLKHHDNRQLGGVPRLWSLEELRAVGRLWAGLSPWQPAHVASGSSPGRCHLAMAGCPDLFRVTGKHFNPTI